MTNGHLDLVQLVVVRVDEQLANAEFLEIPLINT